MTLLGGGNRRDNSPYAHSPPRQQESSKHLISLWFARPTRKGNSSTRLIGDRIGQKCGSLPESGSTLNMAMTRAHDLWIFPTLLQHFIPYLFCLRFSHGYFLAVGCAMDLYRQFGVYESTLHYAYQIMIVSETVENPSSSNSRLSKSPPTQ